MWTGRRRTDCPVCGRRNHTCGPTRPEGVGVVITTRDRSRDDMAENLETYDVEINGVQTQLRLTPSEAKEKGLDKPAGKGRAARDKSRTPANK